MFLALKSVHIKCQEPCYLSVRGKMYGNVLIWRNQKRYSIISKTENAKNCNNLPKKKENKNPLLARSQADTASVFILLLVPLCLVYGKIKLSAPTF